MKDILKIYEGEKPVAMIRKLTAIVIILLGFTQVYAQDKYYHDFASQDRLKRELLSFVYETESTQLLRPFFKGETPFVYFLHITKWDVKNRKFEYCFGNRIGNGVFESSKPSTFIISDSNCNVYVSISDSVDSEQLLIKDGIFKRLSSAEWIRLKEQNQSTIGALYSGNLFIYMVHDYYSNEKEIIRYNSIWDTPKSRRYKTFLNANYLKKMLKEEKERNIRGE